MSAVNKIIYGGNTLVDLSSDTVTADKLAAGYTAHDKTGAVITGAAKSSVTGEVLTVAFGMVAGEVLNA